MTRRSRACTITERGPYSDEEKLGLRAADRLHRSPYELDDEFYAELKQVYRDDQLIELMATAAAFEFFTRFVDHYAFPQHRFPTTWEQRNDAAAARVARPSDERGRRAGRVSPGPPTGEYQAGPSFTWSSESPTLIRRRK